MKPIICVYGLKDPRDGHLYYVGRTRNYARRLTHLCQPRSHSKRYMQWVKDLMRTGQVPISVILEETEFSALRQAERFWIEKSLESGQPLLNSRLPGDRTLSSPTPFKLHLQPRQRTTTRKPVQCLRCGYQWVPYGRRRPRKCANQGCASRYWNRPRTKSILTS